MNTPMFDIARKLIVAAAKAAVRTNGDAAWNQKTFEWDACVVDLDDRMFTTAENAELVEAHRLAYEAEQARVRGETKIEQIRSYVVATRSDRSISAGSFRFYVLACDYALTMQQTAEVAEDEWVVWFQTEAGDWRFTGADEIRRIIGHADRV